MPFPDVFWVDVVDFGVPFDSCIEVVMVGGSKSHDVTVHPKLVLGRSASCGGTVWSKCTGWSLTLISIISGIFFSIWDHTWEKIEYFVEAVGGGQYMSRGEDASTASVVPSINIKNLGWRRSRIFYYSNQYFLCCSGLRFPWNLLVEIDVSSEWDHPRLLLNIDTGVNVVFRRSCPDRNSTICNTDIKIYKRPLDSYACPDQSNGK